MKFGRKTYHYHRKCLNIYSNVSIYLTLHLGEYLSVHTSTAFFIRALDLPQYPLQGMRCDFGFRKSYISWSVDDHWQNSEQRRSIYYLLPTFNFSYMRGKNDPLIKIYTQPVVTRFPSTVYTVYTDYPAWNSQRLNEKYCNDREERTSPCWRVWGCLIYIMRGTALDTLVYNMNIIVSYTVPLLCQNVT